ncbi:MAG: thymidine phosphorylase, partial [Planctomycetales bacterium]|nr:thymidine phosphorylase [Planctomycetales bacterium]
DVTGTVESIPLITASILSKKLAESLDALVLDVKFGSGAFMSTLPAARALAESLVRVANEFGVRTSALLTDMNQPLGRMVGNAVEVHESVDVLRGVGPADVRRLTCELGAELLMAVHQSDTRAAALRRLENALDNGSAFEKFERMVAAQGGRLPAMSAAPAYDVVAQQAGWVTEIAGRELGLAIIELGGGRKLASDEIDASVGIEMLVRVGEYVERDQPLLRVFASMQSGAELVSSRLGRAIQISADNTPPQPLELIVDRCE